MKKKTIARLALQNVATKSAESVHSKLNGPTGGDYPGSILHENTGDEGSYHVHNRTANSQWQHEGRQYGGGVRPIDDTETGLPYSTLGAQYGRGPTSSMRRYPRDHSQRPPAPSHHGYPPDYTADPSGHSRSSSSSSILDPSSPTTSSYDAQHPRNHYPPR